MRRGVLSLLLHGARLLALLVALLAIATWVVYQTRPDLVAWLDQRLEDHRFAAPQARLLAAAQRVVAEPAVAEPEFRALREAFAGFHPGDRQAALHDVATRLLAEALELQGRAEEALVLRHELAAANPQDLTLRLDLVDRLLLRPDLRGEGRRLLEESLALLPEAADVLRRLLPLYAASGEWLAAARCLARHLRTPPGWTLTMTWDAAPQGDPAVQQALLPLVVAADGTARAGVRLPAQATALHFVLPPLVLARQPRLLLLDPGEGPAALVPTADPAQARTLHCALPAPLPASGRAAELRFHPATAPEPAFRDWLGDPIGPRLLAALRSDGDLAAVQTLRHHRSQQILTDAAKVAWSSAGAGFAEERQQALRADFGPALADGRRFTLAAELDGEADAVRLLPGTSAEVAFQLRRVVVRTAEGELELPVYPTAAVAVDRDDAGDSCTTGPGPSLTWRLPAPVRLRGLVIEGILR